MDLRPELMPPRLDEAKVARLAELAEGMDSSGEPLDALRAMLHEFTREAGTELELNEFQGIYGWTDHDSWVRRLLVTREAQTVPDISYDELLELTTRVVRHDGAEDDIEFWFALLEKNLPDPRLFELIHQPDAYFGAPHDRELTPREFLDIALAAPRARFIVPPGGAGGGGAAGTTDDAAGFSRDRQGSHRGAGA
jgi:hypothetical protein